MTGSFKPCLLVCNFLADTVAVYLWDCTPVSKDDHCHHLYSAAHDNMTVCLFCTSRYGRLSFLVCSTMICPSLPCLFGWQMSLTNLQARN